VTVRASQIGPEYAPAPASGAAGATAATLFTVRPGASAAEVEAQLIRETLGRLTSNRREAAQILGISTRALAYKIKLLKLRPITPDARQS